MKAELHKLFYTPIWEFEYPDFKNDQELIVKYLAQDSLYLEAREYSGLQITNPNLHKHQAIRKLTEFIIESAKYAMSDMGYKDKCGITSMWATRQGVGASHHNHVHCNSFLGCSFYAFDIDNSAGGTIFNNSSFEKYVIQPPVNHNKEPMLVKEKAFDFKPGTLLVFPSWASHFTKPNKSQYRIIVGANIMPIGKTNADHFDRYNFASIDNMELMEYGDE
jgi:hypothetical protein